MAFLRLRGLTDSPAEERLLIPQPLPRAWPRLQRPTRGRPALASEDDSSGGSHGVSVRSAYPGALSRRSARAAPGSQPGVPSLLSVSHALEGFILNVRAALFHAADALRFFPSKPSSSSPTFPHSSCGEPFSTFLVTCRCQPVPPRPQGFLSDQKPYPGRRCFTSRQGQCSPGRFLDPLTTLARAARAGWPLPVDESTDRSAAGLSWPPHHIC